MTKLELAQLTWSHMGQVIEKLDSGTATAKIFNSQYDHCRKYVIMHVCPQSFTKSFSPLLLNPQPVKQGDEFYGYKVYDQPKEVLLVLGRQNANISSFNRGYSDIEDFKPAYSRLHNKSVLIYKGGEEKPIRSGVFDVDIEQWNELLTCCLALYMAWVICPSFEAAVGKRDRLKRDYDMAVLNAQSVLNFAGDKNHLDQRSDETDFIDFNAGYGTFERDVIIGR